MKIYKNAFLCLTLVLLSVSTLWTVYAQSASLFDLSVIIGNDAPTAINVEHAMAFTLPQNALSIDFSDYIQITMPGFSSITPPTGLGGEFSGTPVFSVDGNTVKITGIFVLPGKRININGITATNPSSSSNFGVTVSVTTDEAGSIIKNIASTNAVTHPGTVSMTAELLVPQAIIRINGFSAPQTFVSFTEGESVIGTDLAGPTGFFSKVFPAMEPGIHEISLYGVDNNNRSTSIVPLTINAPAFQTTTISNILLSPTVSIHSNEIVQGDPLYATGSAYPGTEVTVFTDIPLRTYTASASATGDWNLTIGDTADYNPGDYRLYALAQTPGGLQSLKSQNSVFTIVTEPGGPSGSPCGNISNGDLNCDGIINLTDFSILMFYWGTSDATADINQDGIVNLTDFSIMMFYWGT